MQNRLKYMVNNLNDFEKNDFEKKKAGFASESNKALGQGLDRDHSVLHIPQCPQSGVYTSILCQGTDLHMGPIKRIKDTWHHLIHA